jgi:hypothetical protein
LNTDNTEKNVVRIVLEGEGLLAHDKMTEVLKLENQYVRLNPSKLGNWIFKRYLATYFEQDKPLIVNDHFDSKEHLKDVIRSAKSPQEYEKALEEALQRVKSGAIDVKEPRKRRGRPPAKPDNNLPEPEQNSLE